MKKIFALIGLIVITSEIVQAQQNWSTAGKIDKERFYFAVGNIQPRSVTTLSSKVMGNVLEVLKREGEAVNEGETVVRIDAKDIASDLEGAKAGLSEASSMMNEIEKGLAAANAQKDQVQSQLTLAETSFERIKQLFERKSVSKQEYDQSEAQLNSIRAQLRAAQAQIGSIAAKKSSVSARMGQAQAGINKVETIRNLAEVVSPFSGRVTSRKIEAGMLAAPGVPLLVIEDDSQLRFEAVVPESLIGGVSEGMQIEVSVDALPGQSFSGKVVETVPAVDQFSHTFMVKIAIPRDPRLRSGMYARGKFPIGKEQVILVPLASVEARGQLDGIWLERDGKPVYSLVRTGRVFGNQIEILAGIVPGEKFLVEPPMKGR
ncbi:efflux RND transporter periplasmic adaptor subunit [bacterium]|nr:efflux RND transporter periplasmic adaptor subunit [bacterium]